MSTRCQVKVSGGLNREHVTLYHHCDGYPDHILEDITETYLRVAKTWEGYRAGKVAAHLCATHPGGFEPEEGHALHGDIEFYYQIEIGDESKPWLVIVNTVPLEGPPVEEFRAPVTEILKAHAAYSLKIAEAEAE